MSNNDVIFQHLLDQLSEAYHNKPRTKERVQDPAQAEQIQRLNRQAATLSIRNTNLEKLLDVVRTAAIDNDMGAIREALQIPVRRRKGIHTGLRPTSHIKPTQGRHGCGSVTERGVLKEDM